MDIVSIPMHSDVPDTTCVAVFDGHGGSNVSAYMYVMVQSLERACVGVQCRRDNVVDACRCFVALLRFYV